MVEPHGNRVLETRFQIGVFFKINASLIRIHSLTLSLTQISTLSLTQISTLSHSPSSTTSSTIHHLHRSPSSLTQCISHSSRSTKDLIKHSKVYRGLIKSPLSLIELWVPQSTRFLKIKGELLQSVFYFHRLVAGKKWEKSECTLVWIHFFLFWFLFSNRTVKKDRNFVVFWDLIMSLGFWVCLYLLWNRIMFLGLFIFAEDLIC